MNSRDIEMAAIENGKASVKFAVELQKIAQDHARKIDFPNYDNSNDNNINNLHLLDISRRLDRIDRRLDNIENIMTSNSSPFCVIHDGVCVVTKNSISLTDEQFKVFLNEINK